MAAMTTQVQIQTQIPDQALLRTVLAITRAPQRKVGWCKIAGSPAFLTNSNKNHVHHDHKDTYASSVSEQGSDTEGLSARPGRGMGAIKCHICMYSLPSPGSASLSPLQTDAGK